MLSRRSICQLPQFHLPEFHRMAFGLQGDRTAVEHLVAVFDQLAGVGVFFVELGSAV
jgi:hypothetical protein